MGSRHARGLALHVRSYHAVASYRGSVDFLKTAISGCTRDVRGAGHKTTFEMDKLGN